MGEFRKVLKGVVWFIFGTGSAGIFSYIAKIFLARILGPNEYGIFIFGLTMLYIFSIFTILGIDSGFSFLIPREKEKNSLISSGLIFSIGLALFVSIIIYTFNNQLALFFGKPEFVNVIKIVSIFIVFYTISLISSGVALGFEDPKLYSIREFLRGFLFFIFGVIVTYFYPKGETPLIVYASVYFFLMIFSLFWIKKYFKFERPKIEYVNKLISYALPLFLLGFILLLLRWTDILMLGKFVSAKEIGIYSAIISTSFSINYVLGAFAILFLPIISRLINEGKIKEAGKIYVRTCTWIAAIVSPFFVLMVSFPNQIINVLFGMKYVKGAILLIPLGFAAFFNTILGPNIQLMVGAGERKKLIEILGITLILNIILNYFLIQKYGIFGAGISTTIAVCLWNFFVTYLIYKKMKVHPLSKSYVLFISIAFLLAGVFYILRKIFVKGTTNEITALIFGLLFILTYGVLIYLVLPNRKEFVKRVYNEMKKLSKKFI